ncbi:MAG: type III toxin-antitoxin system ToxN/AbiQ family toxin [Muribaculaceae bacterium]|nr:type III toxin-antitoxin system ToxN/AbiQ family toxin [Muribaculaceae bacterium]
MKIQFYYVDDKYIDFLKKYEQNIRNFTCVPNVKYANRDKFVYGSVLEINSIKFFVPVSSRVGKNPQYNMDIVTNDKKNRTKGALRFPYMIPVPSKCLIMVDIKNIPDNNEKIRVSKELAFCRRNKDKIEKFALKTYNDVVNSKNEKLVSNSCDFKHLEQAYLDYCLENGLSNPQTEVEKFVAQTKDIKTWSEEAAAKAEERLNLQEKDKSTHEK